MKKKITEKSYAKINLHLHIGAKREDGYHPLSSLFQLISLHDLITLEVTDQSVTQIVITGMESVPITQNLMFMATKLFLDTIGATARIVINITKKIPMQGGLGGGSSNAATMLLLLQQIYNYPLEENQLRSLGLSLGSDVPFFLYQTPCAYVEGRGELVTAITPRNDLSVVLTIPQNFGVSTKQAFYDLDMSRGEKWIESLPYSKELLCHMYSQSVENWRFYNDFKDIICLYNNLYNILHTFNNEGYKSYTAISGSGSALFTITDKGNEFMILDYFEGKFGTQVINNLTTGVYLL
jgi:4-diphosphocytidyl-2-C-methyl-D-erythritol kinase